MSLKSKKNRSSNDIKFISAFNQILYPYSETIPGLSKREHSKEIYDHLTKKNIPGFKNTNGNYRLKIIKRSGNWYLKSHFKKNKYNSPVFINLNGQWTINNAKICANCLYYGKQLRSPEYFVNFYQEYGIPDKGYDYFCGCCGQHQVGFYG